MSYIGSSDSISTHSKVTELHQLESKFKNKIRHMCFSSIGKYKIAVLLCNALEHVIDLSPDIKISTATP